MVGLITVCIKELKDNFLSKRFIIVFLLIYLVGISTALLSIQAIASAAYTLSAESFLFLRIFTSTTGLLPAFIFFVSYFGPIIGILFGFDAINSELLSGTLTKVLSQPIHRDSFINGKFLAGLITISVIYGSITGILIGIGIYHFGGPPTLDEFLRILCFIGLCILYTAFWMSIGILFSIIFKKIATSALASVAIWLFFTFFIFMIANFIVNIVLPITDPSLLFNEEFLAKRQELQQMILQFSPEQLFEIVTIVILTPTIRTISPIIGMETSRIIPNPLPIDQSIIIALPYLMILIIMIFICFAISYILFMKQEIRSGAI